MTESNKQENTAAKAAAEKDEAGKPIAYPRQSNLDKELADANFEANKVLEDAAVSQGAHVEGRKDSEQNKPVKQAEHLATLAKEAEQAEKEREKEKEQLRKDREKAEKDAAKS
jgi:hypothetical protein